MRRIRTVGLCLATAFALSAIAASGASAGELLFKAKTGSIVGGGFLWLSGLALLGGGPGEKIDCQHVRSNGLFLSTTLGHGLLLFLGCSIQVSVSTFKCTSLGEATGNIHIPLAKFHLGLAHLGTNGHIPAILTALPPGGISFSCLGASFTLLGGVIGALQKTNGEPVGLNLPFQAIDLVYKQSSGKQELRSILMPGGALEEYELRNVSGGGSTELWLELSTGILDGFTNNKGEATEVELVEP
jgi:hypothetical protein